MSRITSPSSSVISRSTPWVEGCCGPRLMIIGWRSPGPDSPAAAVAAWVRASASCGVEASAPAIARSVSAIGRPSRAAASRASRASASTGIPEV